MFGFMMIEFHSFSQSFSTLVQTITGGLPFDDMKLHSPIGAAVFTIAWILMVVMVLMNMFVAILTEWQTQVTQDNQDEEEKLLKKVGKNAEIGFFGGCFRYLYTKLRGETEGAPGTIYDYNEHAREANKAMKKATLRNADVVRKALLKGENLNQADIVRHFNGDEAKAADFYKKVKAMIASNSSGEQGDEEEDQELREQQRLKVLQATVERLEQQLRQLRGALHEALVAPAMPGQSLEGYSVRHQQPALPGAVDN